jgi:hypothetical protein
MLTRQAYLHSFYRAHVSVKQVGPAKSGAAALNNRDPWMHIGIAAEGMAADGG